MRWLPPSGSTPIWSCSMSRAQMNTNIKDGVLHKCTAPRLLLTFVEDEGWHRAAERYSEFLRRHEGQRILFLELGVGYNTPVIIKYPFWRMTAKNPNAFYACTNQNQAVCPSEVQRQYLHPCRYWRSYPPKANRPSLRLLCWNC